MSLTTRSPASGLSEQNLNVDTDNTTTTMTTAKQEFSVKKKRAASLGGEAFQVGRPSDDLSPRRRARRSLKPRKSILKGFSSRAEDQDDDSGDTQQFAHTIAFSSSSHTISRRVSFAPNAHVRMFQGTPKKTAAPASQIFTLPPAATGPRPSTSSHSRRSSIHSLNSLTTPNVFAPPPVFVGEGEAQGEESMEIEEDSEESEDEQTVEMGSMSRSQAPTVSVVPADGSSDNEEGDMDEDDMDMEMTQNIYGGIIRRSSTAANQTFDSETDGEQDMSGVSAEEKTMDFTIAVGGLLPPQAPAGAVRNRLSIGYSVPQPAGSEGRNLLPGEPVEGEVEMEMEETVAFGGIIGPDDSLSSASDDTSVAENRERTMTFTYDRSHFLPQQTAEEEDDGTMEMTIATGGIVNYPPVSPARPLPTNTRPMSGTPSFARPTASSAQKSRERETATQKRNVFAPSPSPFKSTTPRKTGLQVAGEVAKRLSFEPTTASGGNKRAREGGAGVEGEAAASAKKAKVASTPVPAPEVDSATEQVFGSPVFHAAPVSRKSLLAPRSSLGTPMRLAQSPAARPRVSFAPPQQQEESLEEIAADDVQAEADQREEQAWEQQPITLASFLEMAGVQFMEGLPGLNRRRSSVARGVLGQSYGGGDREFALHEYSEAQVNSIFLNMYTWAANKLREDVKTGEEELREFDWRCDQDSPAVIQEYLSASDEDKQLFKMTFKSFKTNTQLKAKERWYDWKLQLMETIKPDVQNMLAGMQEDNHGLTAMNEQMDALIPDLKARQAALQAELVKEREAVAEISACDQDELAALKEGIAEQGGQIAVFSSELEESTSKLIALTAKLNELDATKREAAAAISHAKSQCDQFTRSDAIRLQDEYASIQHLHLWRPVKIQSRQLELEFDDEIGLSFDCKDHVAILSTAKIEYLHDKVRQTKKFGWRLSPSSSSRERDAPTPTPAPTPGLFKMLEAAVREMVRERTYTTLAPFVQRIGQLWSTAQRLRAEMHYVNFRHPLRYDFSAECDSLKAGVTIMLPAIRSKVVLEFEISQAVLWEYPASLDGTAIAIKPVYGSPDVDLLHQVAQSTMASSATQGCLGIFSQVCLDLAAQYAGKSR